QGRQVRRRAAGRGARFRDDQSGETARYRKARGFAGSRQGRGLRSLERRSAGVLDGGPADLDRGEEVLRPSGGSRAPPGAREGAGGPGGESQEDARGGAPGRARARSGRSGRTTGGGAVAES